ncbi:hypothetical protein [Pseudomonas sp. UBA4194]|uniref:hypothetical protein n=1 Tax=Pseudomonas sp. UBA4194 TaxID=1947317 RepID=UPI0025D9FB82|nr:hypothetical protein [Pseudomonas sp. UBA4194]
MLRLFLLVLFHVYKRCAAGLASIRGERADEGYARYDEAEEGGRWSALTILTITVLSFYILGSLGFYAKVHIWDTLTEDQKAFIVQSMLVDQQML